MDLCNLIGDSLCVAILAFRVWKRRIGSHGWSDSYIGGAWIAKGKWSLPHLFLELRALDLYCALIAMHDVYKGIPKSKGISMVKYATWWYFLFFEISIKGASKIFYTYLLSCFLLENKEKKVKKISNLPLAFQKKWNLLFLSCAPLTFL
jgi:hypothetical protein